MQYRAAPYRLPLALPSALIEIRIGKARTTGPSTASPHVCVWIIDQI
jgi:hypothetical protein